MRLWEEDGSSVVELAIVSPIVVGALLWAVHLGDLGLVRMRQQEAARFLTWEMSAHRLHDPSRRGGRFEEAARQAEAETRRRYANLRGHDTGTDGRLLTVDVRLGATGLEAVSFAAAPPPSEGSRQEKWLDDALASSSHSSLPGTPLRVLLNQTSRGLRTLLRAQGFAVDEVGAEGSVTVGITTRLLPRDSDWFPERLRSRELAPARIRLTTESWAIADGSDVDLPGTDHPFGMQVDRIALAGVGDQLGQRIRAFGWALDKIPIRLSAQVVSQRYTDPENDASRSRCGDNPLASTGKWRNGRDKGTKEDTISPSKCFDTLPMEADKLGSGYRGDPTYRMLEARGEAYMGCSRSQAAHPGICDEGG